jgi:hypothetical protein
LTIKDTAGINRFVVSGSAAATTSPIGTGGFSYLGGDGVATFNYLDTGTTIGNVLTLSRDPHLIINEALAVPGTIYYRLYVNGQARFTNNTFLDGKVLLTGAPPANAAASGPVPTFPTTAGAINVSNYKLFVKGGILTEEVRVALATTWADYVFNKDYKLPTLEAVEKQIQDKGHLFNVPSAAQVKQDGIELGEMAKIQQEKIEELTLYIIQQNKLNQKQSQEIAELKAIVKTLARKK